MATSVIPKSEFEHISVWNQLDIRAGYHQVRVEGEYRRNPVPRERRVEPCRFYKTRKGCRYGEMCRFYHDVPIQHGEGMRNKDEQNNGGKKRDAKVQTQKKERHHLENSPLSVPVQPADPHSTLVKCGECSEMINGEDELHKHYYRKLLQSDLDHTKFSNHEIFRGNHQCSRCDGSDTFDTYMKYHEHLTREVNTGCYSHRKNLDSMAFMLARRDTQQISADRALKNIRSDSVQYLDSNGQFIANCYEGYLGGSDDEDDDDDEDDNSTEEMMEELSRDYLRQLIFEQQLEKYKDI